MSFQLPSSETAQARKSTGSAVGFGSASINIGTGGVLNITGIVTGGSAGNTSYGVQNAGNGTYNGTITTAITGSGNWLIGTELYNGTTSTNTIGPMNGSVGPTQVYNRSITANEIVQNYNATKGRFIL